ncbi:MAG: alpha/beta hydrolase [Xanthobacteraceae bacterium]
MAFAKTRDGTRLYYEEAGSGTPILFLHEFAGDYRSWEAQMRHFSRRHRCVTYSARGYLPSEIPASADAYSFRHFMSDAIDVLDQLGIRRAHIVGLSMGGYTALQAGLNHPDRALSLTLAGTGSGSERGRQEEFRRGALETAKQFETLGAVEVAQTYGLGPGRVPFEVKDPRGYREFAQHFGQHDAHGSAHTMRGFQGGRPSIYDFHDNLRRLAVPTLIVVGDEDDACIEPSLFLKKMIATSGLAVFPKTGHAINLEEPALFNQALDTFLALVEAGRWPARDPRSVRP